MSTQYLLPHSRQILAHRPYWRRLYVVAFRMTTTTTTIMMNDAVGARQTDEQTDKRRALNKSETSTRLNTYIWSVEATDDALDTDLGVHSKSESARYRNDSRRPVPEWW